MKYTENFEELEKLDSLKNKILKYVMYKKRTEQEIRTKFAEEDENLLEDAIEYLKEAGYISDKNYINRTINEYMALKSMSLKEIEYKMSQKGIDKNLIDSYICENKEAMLEYEISSAKKLIQKKRNLNLEEEKIKSYLFQKGYMSETINIALDELEE